MVRGNVWTASRYVALLSTVQGLMVPCDCVCRRDCGGYEKCSLYEPVLLEDEAHRERSRVGLFEDAIRKS